MILMGACKKVFPAGVLHGLLGLLMLAAGAGANPAAAQAPATDPQTIDQLRKTIAKLTQELRAARQEAASAKAQLATQVYYHQINLAEREWQANNPRGAQRLLDDCPPTLRNWEWHYL